MKTGTIKLIYKEEVIAQLIYGSVNHRKDIIENWRQLRGLKFDECYIQIRPNMSKMVEKLITN